jgi:hypothetical protein
VEHEILYVEISGHRLRSRDHVVCSDRSKLPDEHRDAEDCTLALKQLKGYAPGICALIEVNVQGLFFGQTIHWRRAGNKIVCVSIRPIFYDRLLERRVLLVLLLT